jgi:hypothetical protein
MKLLKLVIITLSVTFLSSCSGCNDCMMCDGKGRAYFDISGEVTCPDCGGDGCSSDGKN